MPKIITRRDFIKGTAYTALCTVVGFKFKPDKKTKVVLIRNKDVVNERGNFNSEIIYDMFNKAIMTLSGKDDPASAIKYFINENDVVGVKSNVWTYMPTPKALEEIIKKRVMDAGVNEQNISIDDRGVKRDPVFKNATALINARPLRTHYWSGIGGCLKNYIMFDIPHKYHPDSCADLGLLWKLPIVEGKTRLNILSALTPMFHGRGPHHYDRRYIWNYNGLIVSTDPVAADAVGLELIKAKRKQFFGEERKFETIPKHVRVADVKHGIGESDLNKIDLIKLGWKDDILI